MRLFVSPHNDDAVLFGAFTLQRERPQVLTVFDSFVQVERGFLNCTAQARRAEDLRAITVLDCAFHSGYVPDSLSGEKAGSAVRGMLESWAERVTEVWLPAVEVNGHEQHNLVGQIGLDVFSKANRHCYLTYTAAGKSVNGTPVPCTADMIWRKLIALACYRTQLEVHELGCWPHFLRDQTEYLVEGVPSH